MSRTRRVSLGIVVLLLLASIAVSGCRSASPSAPATQPSASAPAEKPASTSGSASGAPVKVGEKATSGLWNLTVKNVAYASAAGGAKATAPETLAVVTFDLTNNSTGPQGIGPSSFKLVAADGTAYPVVPTSDKAFIFSIEQPIKAGETRTVKIAYQVPNGVKTFALKFAPFDPSGQVQPAEVDIQ